MNLVFGFMLATALTCASFLQCNAGNAYGQYKGTLSSVTATTICSSTDYCALLLNRIIPVDSQVYAIVMATQVSYWNLPQGYFYLSVVNFFLFFIYNFIIENKFELLTIIIQVFGYFGLQSDKCCLDHSFVSQHVLY